MIFQNLRHQASVENLPSLCGWGSFCLEVCRKPFGNSERSRTSLGRNGHRQGRRVRFGNPRLVNIVATLWRGRLLM